MKKSTMFMNSKNSKNSDAYRLRLNLTDKTDVPRCYICLAFSNLSIYYTCKNIKTSQKTINSKYQDYMG